MCPKSTAPAGMQSVADCGNSFSTTEMMQHEGQGVCYTRYHNARTPSKPMPPPEPMPPPRKAGKRKKLIYAGDRRRAWSLAPLLAFPALRSGGTQDCRRARHAPTEGKLRFIPVRISPSKYGLNLEKAKEATPLPRYPSEGNPRCVSAE